VIQEINLGMTADVGTFRASLPSDPARLGARACLYGRRLPAQQAREISLVNAVLPSPRKRSSNTSWTWRRTSRRNRPLAVYGSKVMINYARDHTIADGPRLHRDLAGRQCTIQKPTCARLSRPRQEKRAPHFADLPPRRKNIL